MGRAMLAKHIAFVGVGAYLQGWLYPAMQRVLLLGEQKPAIAEAEQNRLAGQEQQMLKLNLLCGVLILFCTAMATAV